MWVLENWPYYYPAWQVHTLKYSLPGIPTEEDTRGVKLANERFERRAFKKSMKLARIQGLNKDPRMPGAWIE